MQYQSEDVLQHDPDVNIVVVASANAFKECLHIAREVGPLRLGVVPPRREVKNKLGSLIATPAAHRLQQSNEVLLLRVHETRHHARVHKHHMIADPTPVPNLQVLRGWNNITISIRLLDEYIAYNVVRKD